MIKLMIFDADYTLYEINKINAYEKLYDYLSEKSFISRSELRKMHESIINKLKESGDPEKRKLSYSVKLLLEKFFIENENIIKESNEIFWDRIIDDLIINKETLNIIKKLKEKYYLIIASDEFRENLEKKLNKVFFNYKKYFEFIITCEDTKIMKPSKKYYEIIIQRTGINAKEIVMIGDSWIRDLKPAKEMGIKTVLLNNNEGEPDIFIKNIEELISITI